jgi:hypothetical protein
VANNKQIQIDFIISCIKKGESRAIILRKAEKKWEISRSSFDRILKTAKEEHAKAQQSLKAELEKVEKHAAVAAKKKEILTAQERKVVLSKIATGTIKLTRWWVGKGYEISKTVVPNYSERIAAISELNKMDGDYAPAKIAQTDTKGNDIERYELSNLSDEELRTLVKLQSKGRVGKA